MRNQIQRAFNPVRLSDNKKQKILNEIEQKDALRRARLHWLAGGTVSAAAAIVLAVLLIAGNPPQSVADASGEVSAQTSAVAGVQTQSPAISIAGRITLSINPSVEFRLGEDGMVVEVVGLNNDGAALIEGIDFAGLSLENATIVVVNRLIEQGYISASMVDDVYISVTGSTQPDTLDMMSTIIKTAASQYELAVDTVQTGDNELQVVLGETDEPIPTPGEEPAPTPETTPEISGVPVPTAPADPASLPATLTLQYLKDFAGGVDDIYIDFNGERVNSDIDAYIDIAGMPTGAATFWALNKLIAEGYIGDERPDTKVEFDVSAFGEEAAANVCELVSLMMQEAGLALAATDEGGGHFCLAASGLPAPERTACYTLREIDDPTLIKVREDITEIQMQILSMAFTPEEVEYMLTPRYWAVVPNLIGLPEEKAAELLRLAGLVPEFIYESADPSAYGDSVFYETTEYGTVLCQDSPAGCLCEVGGRYFVWVKTQDAPLISEGNIPPELFQYLPVFLGESGYAEFTLDREIGIGIPLELRQEGWEVLVHAYGGSLKDENGSYLYGRVSFNSDPNNPTVYWTPFLEEWDDIHERAILAYYIYHDGEFVACVGIGLKLISDTEGDTLTYSARPVAFGEDTTYNLDLNLREYVP